MARGERLRRCLYRDPYTIVGWMLFAATFAAEWRNYVRKHEAIYLLGSRRVVDPDFLSSDLTWSTLPPTTFLFDHMLAPLWVVFDDFGVVVVGRLLSWVLMAWSLTMLGRAIRLPPWSLIAGYFLWLLWGQSFANCGQPLEGFQPRSISYALFFFALVFAIRRHFVRAGIASGIATAMHPIVGGYSFLAIFVSMVVDRRQFSWRQVGIFLVSALPFVVPLVIITGPFGNSGVSSEEWALMAKIYVTFAQPHCCDPTFFMEPRTWTNALIILMMAPILTYNRTRDHSARFLACVVIIFALFFFLGMFASRWEVYWILKLYPFQMAAGIPALFLFIMTLASIGRVLPQERRRAAVWIIGIAACAWLVYDQEVIGKRFPRMFSKFTASLDSKAPTRYGREINPFKRSLYAWIRENTTHGNVFITPYLPGFWTYAERGQVAALRYAPQDHRIIEWKQRLDALNASLAFGGRGFEITDQLSHNQSLLPIDALIRMRDEYGATHYVTRRQRQDVSATPLYSNGRYYVYAVAEL
jgi:hypothetical protein